MCGECSSVHFEWFDGDPVRSAVACNCGDRGGGNRFSGTAGSRENQKPSFPFIHCMFRVSMFYSFHYSALLLYVPFVESMVSLFYVPLITVVNDFVLTIYND